MNKKEEKRLLTTYTKVVRKAINGKILSVEADIVRDSLLAKPERPTQSQVIDACVKGKLSLTEAVDMLIEVVQYPAAKAEKRVIAHMTSKHNTPIRIAKRNHVNRV